MNTDQMKGMWHEWKGAAKSQWGKLTDDDLTKAEGDLEQLAGRLQERYGYAKEKARDEVNRFFARGQRGSQI